MKKLFLLSLLFLGGFSVPMFAQDATVIKQEGAQEDLDREKDVSELTFKERIHFGGGISGLSFGNPTSIGLAPMVGYQLGNKTIVGLGVSYQYYSVRNIYGQKLSSSLLGQNVFVRQDLPFLSQLVGQGYLIARAENFSDISSDAANKFVYSNPILVGIGLGSKIGLNLNVMYDLNYSTAYRSPYGTALVVQIGGFFF